MFRISTCTAKLVPIFTMCLALSTLKDLFPLQETCCGFHCSSPPPWNHMGPGIVCCEREYSGVCISVHRLQLTPGSCILCMQLCLHARTVLKRGYKLFKQNLRSHDELL